MSFAGCHPDESKQDSVEDLKSALRFGPINDFAEIEDFKPIPAKDWLWACRHATLQAIRDTDYDNSRLIDEYCWNEGQSLLMELVGKEIDMRIAMKDHVRVYILTKEFDLPTLRFVAHRAFVMLLRQDKGMDALRLAEEDKRFTQEQFQQAALYAAVEMLDLVDCDNDHETNWHVRHADREERREQCLRMNKTSKAQAQTVINDYDLQYRVVLKMQAAVQTGVDYNLAYSMVQRALEEELQDKLTYEINERNRLIQQGPPKK
jgi:hypothetical protein